ncbi:heterokaryon incompatibility protein-domain-containing protein [Xylaria arbuscula]|nr:heterokaryon incompatibility protein-domain-containing protein [Xylaria arbuscula]
MMWLINAKTYTLENITNPQKGSYAILSHTWEDGEVSFQQYRNIAEAIKLKGFKKIDKTVQLAREKNLKYAWVDTCCINQSSSAELSEAINSMFKWYSDAAVCLVFLSDLPTAKITPLIALANSVWSRIIGSREVLREQLVEVHKSIGLTFAQCRWFFRGWTLQELIAPKFVEFYDDGWVLIGTKQTLREPLSCVTRIPKSVLLKDVALRKVSNAQRMSWAADRRTTRVEDIAYCLLGLFGINMSPLYGEGQNAFIRLQEEILKQSDDVTLFAWETEENDDQQYQGILASSPDKFRGSGTITQHKATTNEAGEFRMTNKGLRLNQNNLLQLNHNTAILSLNCNRSGIGYSNTGIHLMNTSHGYVRFLPHKLVELSEFSQLTSNVEVPVFITKTVHPEDSREIAKHSIGLTFEYKEVTKLSIWPQTLYNSIEERGFFDAESYPQPILIESLDHLGHQDQFLILFNAAGDLSICLSHLASLGCQQLGLVQRQDEDVELLIKTNHFKHSVLRGLLSYQRNNMPWDHIFEYCGENSTKEVCLAGEVFICTVRLSMGSRFKPGDFKTSHALEIKITKRKS